MALNDDYFDIKEHLKGTPLAPAFERLMKRMDYLEAEERRLSEENQILRASGAEQLKVIAHISKAVGCENDPMSCWESVDAILSDKATACLQIPDECPHMIVFEDADRKPITFAGPGAKDAAFKAFGLQSWSWNANLYVRIESNHKNDDYPNANDCSDENQNCKAD